MENKAEIKLKKQYARQNKYTKEHYDRVSVTLPKGTKERIKATGKTVNGFITTAVANHFLDDLENKENNEALDNLENKNSEAGRLACKFCKNVDTGDDYTPVIRTEIPFGDIAKLTADVFLGERKGNPSLGLGVMMEHAKEKTITINYCPMCGRRLR